MAIWVSKGPGGLSLKTNPMIGTQEIDVFVTEEHSYTSTTPTHVVEDGSTVSDMVVKEPITVTVEGIVSVSSTASNSKNDVTPERADNAYAVLKQLNRTGTPVKVVTSLEVYENMVVTSFIPKRGKGTGDALRFTATFTQVTLAKTEFITEKKVAKKASSATKKRVVSPTKTTSPGYVWTLNYPGNYQKGVNYQEPTPVSLNLTYPGDYIQTRLPDTVSPVRSSQSQVGMTDVYQGTETRKTPEPHIQKNAMDDWVKLENSRGIPYR